MTLLRDTAAGQRSAAAVPVAFGSPSPATNRRQRSTASASKRSLRIMSSPRRWKSSASGAGFASYHARMPGCESHQPMVASQRFQTTSGSVLSSDWWYMNSAVPNSSYSAQENRTR